MADPRFTDEARARRDARELARIRRAKAQRQAGRRKLRLGCVAGIAAVLALGAFLLFGGGREVEREVIYPWRYNETIAAASERYGVDPYLVCAVIKCESDWNPSAESHVGAQGLMQVMPATAESLVNLGLIDPETYRPDNLFDPVTNIEYGCCCLAFLQRELDSREEVIAGYNAGIGSAMEWKARAEEAGTDFASQVDYDETRYYLGRVLEVYEHYKADYPEPPLA